MATAPPNYADLINQGATKLGLKADDPTALGQIAGYLSQQGLSASVMDHNGTPSDHKLWINGAAWTAISSDNNQPGTYRFDPYEQAAAPTGGFDQKTGAPTAGTSAGTVLGQTHTAQPGSTTVGPAIARGSQYGDAYGAALLASQLQRKKATAAGRSTTILGGFAPGAPTTAPATALGA